MAKPVPPPPQQVKYFQIPTFADFARDIGWDPKLRKNADPVMQKIFSLLEGLADPVKTDAQKKYLMCELFFATNYWRRNHNVQLRGLVALKDVIEEKLHLAFGCPANMVAATLSKYYDCPVDSHGIYVDTRDCPTQARTDIEKAKLASAYERYRVHFDKGKAVAHNWRDPKESKLKPVNTEELCQDGHSPEHDLGVRVQNHAYFVLTRFRELYVAPFFGRANAPLARYHSSIPNQEAVQCAGSMLIEGGVFKEVCDCSGHYKPHGKYFVNVLEQLKTQGVPIKGIKLSTIRPNEVTRKDEFITVAEDAEDYLANHGTWEEIVKRREFDKARRKDSAFALRAVQFKQRLQDLAKRFGRDRALEMIFAEQFEKVGKGGPDVWTKAWKAVMESLAALAPDFEHQDDDLGAWILKKNEWLRTHSPMPPRPTVHVHA